jgi:putative FmdB family regulatory protein
MPRYRYYCETCDLEFVVLHGINDEFNRCLTCEQETVQKVLSTPIIIKKTQNNNSKVGDITHEYIEVNKQILKEEKEKAKEQDYE